MGKAPAEMAVIDKTYGLLLWTGKHLLKFPRLYHYQTGPIDHNRSVYGSVGRTVV